MTLSRCLILPLLTLLLSACVEQPPNRAEGKLAQLRSWMEIVSVNGDAPEEPYNATLLPGTYQLEVLYETYQKNYLCHFEFEAFGGRTYEVVDHATTEPLILYRLRRANGAWMERLDPVTPVCEEHPL